MQPPSTLETMQSNWAAYLRHPQQQRRPEGAPARPMRVYEELVFNNMKGFLDQCFPVCQFIVGAQAWTDYSTVFFANWSCVSPYFRDIPQEFVAFSQAHAQQLALPEWLPELAHYEWVELAVDTAPDTAANYGAEGMAVAPSLRLLAYEWAVQTIAPNAIPTQPQPTFLLVYRDADYVVRFVQLTPVSARLLELLQQHQADTVPAFSQLAKEMRMGVESLQTQAQSQIEQWLVQGILHRRAK